MRGRKSTRTEGSFEDRFEFAEDALAPGDRAALRAAMFEVRDKSAGEERTLKLWRKTGNSVDDPDQNFYENYACGSLRNYTNYCNADLPKLYDQQSMELDLAKRKAQVWDIERKLIEDVARPIIMHNRVAACWQPYVKNISVMVNSIYNGWRFEDIWLDK